MNKDLVTLKCKTKIYVGIDVLLNHKSFRKIYGDDEIQVYESIYEEIIPGHNSNCCNSIEINAKAMEATAQIEIIPVCEIDGTEVTIKTQIKKQYWSHLASPFKNSH